MKLEKLDKEDPTTAMISSTDITKTAVKLKQDTSPNNDKANR